MTLSPVDYHDASAVEVHRVAHALIVRPGADDAVCMQLKELRGRLLLRRVSSCQQDSPFSFQVPYDSV